MFYLIRIITNSDHIRYFLIWMGCHCVLSGLDITWVYLIHLLLVMIWFIYQFGFIWFRYHGVLINLLKYHLILSVIMPTVLFNSNITGYYLIQISHGVFRKKSQGIVYDITLYNLIDVNIIGFRYRGESSDSAIPWFCHM